MFSGTPCIEIYTLCSISLPFFDIQSITNISTHLALIFSVFFTYPHLPSFPTPSTLGDLVFPTLTFLIFLLLPPPEIWFETSEDVGSVFLTADNVLYSIPSPLLPTTVLYSPSSLALRLRALVLYSVSNRAHTFTQIH